MSFILEEKFEFIKKLDSIDKTGQINKGKMASMIYDLVDKKTKELRKEMESISDFKVQEGLKETLDNIVVGFKSLSEKIDEVEKKIADHDKILGSLNKAKIKKKKIKLDDKGEDTPKE